MRRILSCIFLIIVLCASISARAKYQGYAERGGKDVKTSPTVTYELMETFPLSTVTVYLAGTLTIATIYSDNAGTARANPFTSDTNAYFFFYANDGRYDIRFSGTGIAVPFTRADILVNANILPSTIIDCNASPFNVVVNDGAIANNGARVTQCLQAAVDYSVANNKVSVSAQFDPGLYTINDALSTANFARAQITLPLTLYTSSVSLSIEPKGNYSSAPSLGPGWLTSSQAGNAVVFKSTLTGLTQTADGTPFLMGGPDRTKFGIYPAGRSWLIVTLRDIGFTVPSNPSIGCFNGIGVGQVIVKNFSCHAQAPNPIAFPTDYTLPTNPTGIAILVPSGIGDGAIYEGKTDIAGMYAGVGIGEHTVSSSNLFIYKCRVGLNYEGYPTGNFGNIPYVVYPPVIQHYEDVSNIYGIATVDPSSGVIPISIGHPSDYIQPIIITAWTIEEASSGSFARVAAIHDPASRLGGTVSYRAAIGGGATAKGFTQPTWQIRNIRATSIIEPHFYYSHDILNDPLYASSSALVLTGRAPVRNQLSAWNTIPSSGTETIDSFVYNGEVTNNSVESGNYVNANVNHSVTSVMGKFDSLGSSWMAIGVRYQDQDNYWRLRWDASGTATFQKKTAVNTYTTIGTANITPTVGVWYTLVIMVNGTVFNAYVDGNLVSTSVGDGSYSSEGKIFIMGGGATGFTIHMKNLRVTPL